MTRPVGVIGVPTSAGAFAPGQEQAPQALRAAGLIDEWLRGGAEVRDHGDCQRWRWRPDRRRPRAQNLDQVVEIVRDTARRVGDAAAAGETTLVLGGDCTVGIGTVAGHVAAGDRVGLIYFDSHADLNVPEGVSEGALDWMGMAHMLGEPEATPELIAAGPRVPLLTAEQVLLFGWGPAQATAFERQLITRRSSNGSNTGPAGTSESQIPSKPLSWSAPAKASRSARAVRPACGATAKRTFTDPSSQAPGPRGRIASVINSSHPCLIRP